MRIILKTLWIITKDRSSESETLFNTEVKIVCFTLVLVTVDYSKVLKLFFFSFTFFVINEEENIAV